MNIWNKTTDVELHGELFTRNISFIPIFKCQKMRKILCNKLKLDSTNASDVVKDPKPRNPRGTTSTFKSPTRTRPRKLIPEQNPKPDIQTPKPRKTPKVLNLYIKYLKNTIKINKKKFWKFFLQNPLYFFLPFYL